ncbi:MAG: hypothetical protein Kow0099_20470 [Candidatus Abyssubacteria bacterium]
MKELYAGFDLHSSSSYLGIIDEEGTRFLGRKLANDPEAILATLRPHRKKVAGIAVESTYTWYWLVDALMDEGYRMHLANPSKIKQYEGHSSQECGDSCALRIPDGVSNSTTGN